MAGGPIGPSSVCINDTTGKVYESVYRGSGSNTSPWEEGIFVKASLDANVYVELRFPVPPTLPTGTLKIRVIALANATSGDAKVSVGAGTATPAASPAAGGNPSGVTINYAALYTITWAASENDRYKEYKNSPVATPAGNDILIVGVEFVTTGWTLAAASCWNFFLIWE